MKSPAIALALLTMVNPIQAQPASLAPDTIILNAAIRTMDDRRPAAEAVAVANEHGADLSQHVSQPLSANLVAQADYLITMTQSHALALASRFAAYQPRPRLLCQDGMDIADPIGGDLSVYRECAQQIIRQLERILAEVQN